MRISWVAVIILESFLFGFVNAQPVTIVIREVYAGNDTVKKASELLKEQLSKAGYTINILNSGTSSGFNEIVITQAKIAKDKNDKSFANYQNPEAFKIECKKNNVLISGNSALGIQQAVFVYLESLGFRYYFPHPAWYIIPKKPDLFRPLNILSSPSFDHRKIWYGYGTTGSASSDSNYRFWVAANKLGGSMQAVFGDAYDDIVSRNKETFQQHPEWFYPVQAKGVIPGNPKFDLTNESLIQFILKDVLDRFEKAKQKGTPLKMITLCPSDGNGTCNTPECQKLGSITDRVFSLINKAAKEAARKYPGSWIGGMAYSEYSAPPNIKLEPNTFVSIATAFNNSKYPTEELIKEWGKKAGKVGVYDYLGLYVWDFDLPGKGQASNIGKISESIKKYYHLGAKGYEAESTPGSINKGLGHYIVTKLLWDINSNIEIIKREFFLNCFGKASSVITALWNEWEGYPYDEVRESDLAAWIDSLQKAQAIEQDTNVSLRLTHIKSYLHYLYLYRNFRKTKSENDLVSLLTYCYNTSDLATISGYPALWQLGNTSSFAGLKINDPQAKYKKSVPQFKDPRYINQLILEDRKNLRIKEKIIKTETTLKLRKNSLSLPPVFSDKKYLMFKATPTMFTGPHYFVCRITKKGIQNFINFSGGLVTGGGGDMPITISVYAYRGSIENTGSVIQEYKYYGKRDTQQISLKNLAPGDYLIKVFDPSKMFRINFSNTIYYSLIALPDQRFNGYTRYMSFYVPKGTLKFRVFKEIVAIIVSPKGRLIDMTNNANEEFDIDVMPGEEGMWLINFANGRFHIEGVPPYFSMSPEQMLLPY